METRTVYTWSVSYRIASKSHREIEGGMNIRWLERSADGGPYLREGDAIDAAARATKELIEIHGSRRVCAYHIRSHEAPVNQPAFGANRDRV